MKPYANTSPQAIELRTAALLFASNAAKAPVDDEDRIGQAANRRLLAAAVAFAPVYAREYKRASAIARARRARGSSRRRR